MTTNAAQKNDVFTVLFVDDEPNILRAIKRALFTLDINMLLADSGMKALELMEQQDVHVVISDMKIPGILRCTKIRVFSFEIADKGLTTLDYFRVKSFC